MCKLVPSLPVNFTFSQGLENYISSRYEAAKVQKTLLMLLGRAYVGTLSLRRLERVFRCCSVCGTMEDYKEEYLMVWTNYMSPCSSIVGLYFKGTCDVISVTMAAHKVHKSVP